MGEETESKKPSLILPNLVTNVGGWGPSLDCPRLVNGMPFVSFNKSDRLGMIADWTGDTYSDKRMLNKYQVQYGSHSHYNQYDDDEAFQLVDQNRNQRTGNQRGRIRVGQRNMRNRNQKNNPNNLQVLRARNARNPRGNSRFGHRGGGNRRYDPKNQAKKRDASVNIRPEWKILEEMDFPRLGKLSLPGIGDAKDIYTCGSLEYYDKSYDRVNCKNEKRLQRINRIHHKVTTTDDPIIRKLSKTDGTVYATDAIISTLMCATRSVASWDIIVNRVGNKLFFDKRDDSEFDLLTVNETAADPPFNEESNSINNPRSLALEATYINHNFSQQVLKNTDKKEEKYCFENKNPFVSEEDESDVASVAYRYRKFDLGDGVELVVRCEHDAVTVGTNGTEQFMNIKALNEWDSRVPGAIDWRQKLDIQRGAVLANELKNNSCKLAKWTVQALLAGSDHLKFGYVSRVHFRDSAKHAILGTQQFKPREFADQTNLNLDNAWGVLRCIIDTCMKLDQGKYLILKDPNKQTLLIYDIPDDTFETDNEDDDDEEDIEEEDEDEKEEEVTGK